MITRRTLMRRGLGAVAASLLARRSDARSLTPYPAASACGDATVHPLGRTRPIRPIAFRGDSTLVDGLPFAKWFTGDNFTEQYPFHNCENCFKDGQPPQPTEELDLVIVGGGLSGLSTAYLLRDYNPVLFELRERFGGVSQGESWAGNRYSLGGAYVITPDPGSFLDKFYRELGLDQVVRVDSGDFEVELNGELPQDFWSGMGLLPDQVAAFEAYAAVVTNMAEKNYPEIPLPKGKDNQWILDLDNKNFKQDVEDQMGVPAPPLLAAAIQAYFYSSFGAGWDEISAASGWNFVAAEEYDRWVFPGGNTYMVDALWGRLTRLEGRRAGTSPPCHLRAGCKVVEVRLVPQGRVQVTYVDAAGRMHSVLAKKVVMACAKMLCKYIIHDLEALDHAKFTAMDDLNYAAYVVINVLLNEPQQLDFYDIFLLGDGNFPMSPDEALKNSKVADVLNGSFAGPPDLPRSVLTLYWPLPFGLAQSTLIVGNPWERYAESLVPQLKSMLALLKINPQAVQQIRMSRWGHAMPIARPELISQGITENARRPLDDKIYFINQDNWALPAVENCLLDAEIFVPQIAAGL